MFSRSKRHVWILLGVLGLALGSGCKKQDATPTSNDDETLLAEDGTDTSNAETDAEVVTSSLVAATASGGSLALASTHELALSDGADTTGVGDGAKALYFPRNCLTVTNDDASKTVTYAFDGCTGPNGIARVTGTIKVTYALSPGKLVLQLVATNLHLNRATLDWSATAEITSEGTARRMAWHGTFSGTTARDRAFSRTNDKVVMWRFGERCFGVSGVSEGDVRGRYLRTEIADFRRCQGGCPEAGGRITVSNANARIKVEILFDGTDVATYRTPKGSTSVKLACSG